MRSMLHELQNIMNLKETDLDITNGAKEFLTQSQKKNIGNR